MAGVQTGTIQTRIPARLDRLPWSRFHWLIIMGLGTVWILDGFEVTVVGSVAGRMTQSGSGISITAAQIGIAAACYVAGACTGALFFGQLTDRFGRKRLFMVTLAVYITATVATGFSFNFWYFFIARFFTGAGIGGEYSAINSAIDELIPARMRGTIDLFINGSYWAGSALGSAAALLFLDTAFFPKNLGWRLTFFLGAALATGILLVRRNVPESPRWLFIHGQEEEAERIVDGIEEDIRRETGVELAEPDQSLTVRQRTAIPFREIARVAVKVYPRRTILGLSLFVGQAFIYNGIVFNLGGLVTKYYGVPAGEAPLYIIIYAVANLAGPLTLGRLFDTLGRKLMISSTYLGSAVFGFALAAAFALNLLTSSWGFIVFISATFFLASAGASAAYLTVSEIFPMETRALAIAFFYAVGTAAGGIAGPLVFSTFLASRVRTAEAFMIGSAIMTWGGIAEIFFGVRAERESLENIAMPMTAAEAGSGGQAAEGGAAGEAGGGEAISRWQRAALEARAAAEEARAASAEHRARSQSLLARDGQGGRGAQRQRAEQEAAVEATLAEIEDLRAAALDERAHAHDARAGAEEATGEQAGRAGQMRAQAAEARAAALAEQAEALSAGNGEDAERHRLLAEAATARSRACEQRAEEVLARDGAAESGDGEVSAAQAEVHRRWAEREEELALAHAARARGDSGSAGRHSHEAEKLRQQALAGEQRVEAAEHRRAAAEERAELGRTEAASREQERRRAQEERHRQAEERIRAQLRRRQQADRTGLRRLRPGPGRSLYSPGMFFAQAPPEAAEEDLEREVGAVARAVAEHGPIERRDLEQVLGARYWGPGRYRSALRQAARSGRIVQLSPRTFGPPDGTGGDDQE